MRMEKTVVAAVAIVLTFLVLSGTCTRCLVSVEQLVYP